MAVNGATPIVASVPGPGHLDAWVSMKDRPNAKESGTIAAIRGFGTQEADSLSLKWPVVDLKIGDVVEIRLLPDGKGDAPNEVRRSSESPYNLLSSAQLAKELVQVVSEFEERISKLLEKSKELETPDEHRKFGLACAHVAWEVGQNFLYPVYRRHRELIPEELKGDLL